MYTKMQISQEILIAGSWVTNSLSADSTWVRNVRSLASHPTQHHAVLCCLQTCCFLWAPLQHCSSVCPECIWLVPCFYLIGFCYGVNGIQYSWYRVQFRICLWSVPAENYHPWRRSFFTRTPAAPWLPQSPLLLVQDTKTELYFVFSFFCPCLLSSTCESDHLVFVLFFLT